MSNIASIMGVNYPKVSTAYKAAPDTSIHIPDPTLIYGVELEIEHCSGGMEVSGMTVTTDGSLRNDGLEFITHPMPLSELASCLKVFFAKNDLNEDNYSERTSIHVHTNCTDLTTQQLASVCLLYQVFERVLFRFIGGERHNNIFCVPWAETNITYRTVSSMQKGYLDALHDWHKYTALNLIPLQSIGTVEWRHMDGHCDVNKIIKWLQLIGCIFAYARKNTHEDVLALVLDLNTSSAYRGVLETVFERHSEALQQPGFELLLEDGVLNMKYTIMNPAPKKMFARLDPLRPATINVGNWDDYAHIIRTTAPVMHTINLTNPEVQF